MLNEGWAAVEEASITMILQPVTLLTSPPALNSIFIIITAEIHARLDKCGWELAESEMIGSRDPLAWMMEVY